MLSELFRDDDPIPIGVRVDDLVIGLRIDGRHPDSGGFPDDAATQLRNAHENLRRCVLTAGLGLDNVAQVSFFLSDFATRAEMNPPWVEMFPSDDDRPTYKFLPALLPPGQLVHVEFFGVAGGRRRDIQIPGVAHANPIPMAVRIGRYLFTSRLLAYDPATQQPAVGASAQTKFLFENAETVLAAAGMGWGDIVQGGAFGADEACDALIEEGWRACFPDPSRRPPLHPLRYGAGSLLVMLELIGREGGLGDAGQ